MLKKILIILAVVVVVPVFMILVLFYKNHEYKPVKFKISFSKQKIHPEIKNNSPLTERKFVRVLAIDGGGVRGDLPLHVLNYLEKTSQQPVCELFDYIIGTSSGAITAAALTVPYGKGIPKFTAREALLLYRQLVPDIFTPDIRHRIKTVNGLLGPKLSEQGFHSFLKQIFGKALLSEALIPIVIPAYNLSERKPDFFSSRDENRDYLMADVVAGATAAPTIFAPATIFNVKNSKPVTLIDGSLFINNPSLEAYFKAKVLFPNHELILVSLGTGGENQVPKISDYEAKRMGLFKWLPNLFLILFRSHNLLVQQQVKDFYEFPETDIALYKRYTIHLPQAEQNLFSSSLKNLNKLDQYGETIVKKNKNSLNNLSKLLVLVTKVPDADIDNNIKSLIKSIKEAKAE